MAAITVLDSGHVHRGDSAFPTLVRLDNGEILCGFSVGGGPNATGGTECARSTDGGRTWVWEGVILPPTQDPATSNSLRLSRTGDGVVLAYGARKRAKPGKVVFGKDSNEPVLCRSHDAGRSWSDPQTIPTDVPGPFEISNPVLVLADGRWLAPAATLSDPQRLGERVIAFESADQGRTWPAARSVLEDPMRERGFFEQKLIELSGGRVMAVAWTVTLGDYADLENHFALSLDAGRTWGPIHSTGIRGQTMTPVWLGADRLLVLYNRRYGQQAVVMCLARLHDDRWEVEFEDVLWDAAAQRDRPKSLESGIDEFDEFQFGLPSALRLADEEFLAVHWCKEAGEFGIRWTRLHLS